MFNTFKCDKDCCKYKVSPYKNVKFYKGGWKSNVRKIVKAGSFIIDPSVSKILLVQSRGQFWGPPKGSIQDEETYEECAIRETFEETGITIKPSEFLGYTLVKNEALYYTLELKEDEIVPQNHIKDNDANGIGWFNIDCLNTLIESSKINLNQHCKILIKKFFRKSVI